MNKFYTPEEFPVRTEVFSRVVGYIRPISQWNEGKQEEFKHRKTFERENSTEKKQKKGEHN